MKELRETLAYFSHFSEHKVTTFYKIPFENQLFLPWNWSLLPITLPQHEKSEYRREGHSKSPLSQAAGRANLVLMPSPGERFWLDIGSLDHLLQKAQTAVFAEVNRHLCAS